ncbi:polysaccharide pyruvyl transferase CsaB [Clostridia bacterium]|nr:polysaccharide pyruvyl transferase CsaB [Clostridia bacterium]
MIIGIFGWYGYYNLGDDLILDTFIKALNKETHGATIEVFAKPDAIPYLRTVYTNVNFIGRTAKNLIKYVSSRPDILIIGGGGVFPHKNAKKVAFFAALAKIMRIRRKKVGLIGVGLSYNSLSSKDSQILLKSLLKSCNVAALRQQLPKELASCVPKKSNIINCTDLILSSCALQGVKITNTKEKNIIVVALANIFSIEKQAELEVFANTVARLIKNAINLGYTIKLVPFMNQNDQKLHDIVAAKVNETKCISVPYEPEFNNAVSIIANCKAAICMRFHAAVIALRFTKPVFAISYSDKVEILMQQYELSDYCKKYSIDTSYYGSIADIKYTELINGFESIIKNETEIIKAINKNQEKMQKLADKNIEAIRALLVESI